MGFAALPWISGLLGIDALKTKGVEWAFNAALAAFAIYTWFQMAALNASATDITSVFALIWEWLSVGIGGLALFAFWAVKGEAVKHAAKDFAEEARKGSAQHR
jgi:hypothetical protein